MGTAAANFLNLGIGARAEAMGGAFTALADDGAALYWNPAGLSQIEDTHIVATYSPHFQGITTGYLALGLPLLEGAAGLGVNYINMGEIEGRDEYGSING